jgi:hypothetical protein
LANVLTTMPGLCSRIALHIDHPSSASAVEEEHLGARSHANRTRDHHRRQVIDLACGVVWLPWVRFPSPAPMNSSVDEEPCRALFHSGTTYPRLRYTPGIRE